MCYISNTPLFHPLVLPVFCLGQLPGPVQHPAPPLHPVQGMRVREKFLHA